VRNSPERTDKSELRAAYLRGLHSDRVIIMRKGACINFETLCIPFQSMKVSLPTVMGYILAVQVKFTKDAMKGFTVSG